MDALGMIHHRKLSLIGHKGNTANREPWIASRWPPGGDPR